MVSITHRADASRSKAYACSSSRWFRTSRAISGVVTILLFQISGNANKVTQKDKSDETVYSICGEISSLGLGV
jgi:hypothetical protein